jgi:hypothetical protein
MAEPQDVGQPTYEDLRSSAPEKVRNAWTKADRLEDQMRMTYDQVGDDSRHSKEYKQELSWNAYDKLAPQVLEAREEAREQLEKSSRLSRIQSLPFPPGETPRTTDTSKLLLSQGEYHRISRKLDRIEKRPGPMRTSVVDVLRNEWAEALEKGETEGASICRGILSVIDEYGFDVDDVEPFRRVSIRTPWSMPRGLRLYSGTCLTRLSYPSLIYRGPVRGRSGARRRSRRRGRRTLSTGRPIRSSRPTPDTWVRCHEPAQSAPIPIVV